MATAIVTGSGGLIGSESVRALVESGWDVIGLENDMRARFFGPEVAIANHAESGESIRSSLGARRFDDSARPGEA